MKPLKPFNLEEALAGKPVQTRDGGEVTQLTLFKTNAIYPLLAVVDGIIKTYTDAGTLTVKTPSDYDLFMKAEMVEAWVNVYGGANPHFGTVYTSEAVATACIDSRDFIKTIKISATLTADEETK